MLRSISSLFVVVYASTRLERSPNKENEARLLCIWFWKSFTSAAAAARLSLMRSDGSAAAISSIFPIYVLTASLTVSVISSVASLTSPIALVVLSASSSAASAASSMLTIHCPFSSCTTPRVSASSGNIFSYSLTCFFAASYDSAASSAAFFVFRTSSAAPKP